MRAAEGRVTVLLVGPVPPPAHGVARATQLMLGSSTLAQKLNLVHLDTTDPRGVANMGRLDWGNVSLAVKHVFTLFILIARHRPDVVLLTASQGKLALLRDSLFVVVSRMLRRPVVTYLRGGGYAEVLTRQGRLAGGALRHILKASARTIVLGANLVGMAREVYPDARVAVVPNGCPPAVPPEQVGVREADHPIVLYLGAISRTKGVDDLLRAAGEIAASVPSFELVLCGEWSPAQYRAEAMGMVERNGLSGVVSFPGPVADEEKVARLTEAWALAVPSPSEGQPWAILEAMSAGIPVVATDTGAIPETVADGETGFVIPAGDSKALAQRVTMLLQDDSLWERMSRESARRYRELFTADRSHGALATELEQVSRDG